LQPRIGVEAFISMDNPRRCCEQAFPDAVASALRLLRISVTLRVGWPRNYQRTRPCVTSSCVAQHPGLGPLTCLDVIALGSAAPASLPAFSHRLDCGRTIRPRAHVAESATPRAGRLLRQPHRPAPAPSSHRGEPARPLASSRSEIRNRRYAAFRSGKLVRGAFFSFPMVSPALIPRSHVWIQARF